MTHPQQPALRPTGLVQPVNGVTVHQPVEPRWDCAICGKAWPCSAERARLLAKFAGRPDQLGCHLWQELERAARRVPEPAALYERFLVWAPGVLPPSPIDPGLGMPCLPPSAAATRPGDGGVGL